MTNDGLRETMSLTLSAARSKEIVTIFGNYLDTTSLPPVSIKPVLLY